MRSVFYDNKGFEVEPMSNMDIYKKAQIFRLLYSDFIDPNGRIDICGILEFGYGNYEIKEDFELPGVYGKTLVDGTIQLRRGVYEKALKNDGHCRHIIAHEFGHAFLHIKNYQNSFAKEADVYTPTYKNSEWQSNEFSGLAMLPPEILDKHWNDSDNKIMEMFGVSHECLDVRRRKQQKLLTQIKTLAMLQHC